MCLCGFHGQAQMQDSVDVTDYDVTLDLSADPPMQGEAVVTLQLLRPCDSIELMLAATVDSVCIDGVRVPDADLAALPVAGIAPGQTVTVHVWYHGNGYVESGGWGGLHFDRDMTYNLGVGFNADPHVMGRAFFPCRDNFHDKATYTLRVKTSPGWTAECGGMLQSRTLNADNTESSLWRLALPASTYLVSVSQAAWKRIQDSIPSLYGTYPATYGYLYPDSAMVRRVFAELDSVVPMFERCFGPYRWGRIGYIATNRGSMEHVNNIGLAYQAMATMDESGQSTIAHELGHAWFGNLVTCSSDADMWINEGGASFTSEVAMQAVKSRSASDDYYQRNLESVLRTTHVTDHGYRPLSAMPHAYTYGSTTYDKGWMVWHSLRGYLGEEAFYAAIRRLMNSCAFGDIDSYRLRDSLSLYTGVDLTAFFDFHVFGPGFVDYHVEMSNPDEGCLANEVEVHIRQQGVGTTNLMRQNRVPLTFYARPGFDSTSCRRVATFDGEETWAVFSLPFVPAFCVLDGDKEISDAATVSRLRLDAGNHVKTANVCHLKGSALNTVTLYAEHHWGKALGSMPEGVVRQAGRYWILRGDWSHADEVKMDFRYVLSGYSASDYEGLDLGFYNSTATHDSLALLYRAGERDEWHVVSRVKSTDKYEGFLSAEYVMPGEYTLAVIDSTLLSIGENDAWNRENTKTRMELFPNPLRRGEPLTLSVDSDSPFSVTIFDDGGRRVWQKEGCRNGQKLRPDLEKGTYFVRIENNFISLQSKLILL